MVAVTWSVSNQTIGCEERHGGLTSHDDSLELAAYGLEREMQRLRRFGETPEPSEAYYVCETCGGTGQVSARKLYAYKACPACHGKASRVDCLSAIQDIRQSWNFRATRARISAELDADEERSRRFTAAYRAAEANGERDPHTWAYDHMGEFAA